MRLAQGCKERSFSNEMAASSFASGAPTPVGYDSHDRATEDEHQQKAMRALLRHLYLQCYSLYTL